MTWQKNRRTIWFKTITMLVVCLFTLNSISWANPDLLTNKAERSCLNVHSGFNLAANPRLYHEMHVKLFAQAILESVKKENFKHFKKRIPIFGTDGKGKSENNLNIVLDYSNKKKDETGRNWLIQCDVFDDEKTYFWKYYVVVDIESGTISLRERNGSERMKYSWTSHTGLKIDIVGFDEKTFKRYWHNIRYIFWEESIIRRIRTSRGFVTKGPKLVKYDFRNLERVIIYSAADKAYKEFGGEVKLSQAKNSLFIPVRSPECIYTDIAKALWHVVDPERIESNVKGWNGEIRGLLKAHEPQMIERIERCISWDWQNMDPDYLYAARSMWLKLEEPIVINGTMFRYVKLKGTTYKGIYPPSSELFKDGASKGLIADENGRVKSIDLTCISGTMEAGRAENEFNVTNDAFNRDITRSYAVAYGSYPRIGLNRLEGGRLKGDRLEGGFVVLLVPEAPEMTFTQIALNELPGLQPGKSAIDEKADTSGAADKLKEFIFNHGVQLRRGNDEGYFFKYPHHDNCVRFEGEKGPEYRMKDFDPVETIDRATDQTRMVAARFIDVHSAIEHYKGNLKKHPDLERIFRQRGLDPVRIFLEGYFYDKKDDPRFEVLYKALNAEKPFKPRGDRPAAELKHPVIELIKEVEYGQTDGIEDPEIITCDINDPRKTLRYFFPDMGAAKIDSIARSLRDFDGKYKGPGVFEFLDEEWGFTYPVCDFVEYILKNHKTRFSGGKLVFLGGTSDLLYVAAKILAPKYGVKEEDLVLVHMPGKLARQKDEKTVYEYLKGKGIFEGDRPIAFIDNGWQGSIAKRLKDIIEKLHSPGIIVTGYLMSNGFLQDKDTYFPAFDREFEYRRSREGFDRMTSASALLEKISRFTPRHGVKKLSRTPDGKLFLDLPINNKHELHNAWYILRRVISMAEDRRKRTAVSRPQSINGMNIVWSGEYEKRGLRVAIVQIEGGDFFHKDTARMAKIVRDLLVLGDNAPDLVIFPEDIGMDRVQPAESLVKQREEVLEKTVLETGMAVGFSVNLGLNKNNFYTISKAGKEGAEKHRFTKRNFKNENRVVTIETPYGEYKIAFLICMEGLYLEGALKEDTRSDDLNRLIKDIRSSDLLVIPSGMGAEGSRKMTRAIFEKLEIPVATANLSLFNPEAPNGMAFSGGDSIFISQESGETALLNSDLCFEGVIVADVPGKPELSTEPDANRGKTRYDLGKGVLYPTVLLVRMFMHLLGIKRTPGRDDIIENYVVPVVEEAAMYAVFVYWGGVAYVVAKFFFALAHSFQDYFRPLGKKTLVPAFLSALTVISLYIIPSCPYIRELTALGALFLHILINRFLTLSQQPQDKITQAIEAVTQGLEEKKEPIEPDIEEQYERPSVDELPESILELMRKADVKSVERLFQIGREEPAEGAIYAVTALGVILRERESEERIHTTVPLFLKIIALNRGPKVAMAVLGEFEDTLRTTKLETKIYNNVSDDLINIVERRHDNIGKYTLKLIENLLGRSDLDGDSFRSLSVRVMRQSLLDKESPFEQPLEVLENILLKAEGLKDFHYQMAFYLLEEMVKANPELLEQAITVASNFVKSREKLDPVISDYVERFFRDIAMEGTVSFDHVMRAFANILSTGGVAPDVYRKIAFLMERLDVNMSFFKRNYTLQEMREFILACVNATKKDLNLAKPVLIGLASTEPKAFDENTLLKMSGYYPEGELRFLAFFVTQRIGKEPRTKGVQKMLERKVAFKNGPGNLSNRARKILGRGKRKVLIYHSVEDGMGDELIRVSTIAQALLDLNPELKIVYYTNRTNIPDNNRVTVKNLKDGFKEKDSFDMVIDYHGADDKDEADKRLSRIKTRIRCICEDARFEKFSPNKIIIDGAEVLLPKPGYNVYDGVYRFCAEMGLPFKVGEEGPRTFLYGRIDLDCEAWWTENVEERRGSRPVFIFNGFGGSFEEKGITSLDAQAKAIEDLIDHGIFVVITPNGQPWGTKKVTEDIIERIAPKYSSKRNYIAITPEPGKMPRLLKHAVAKSDLTVTVEGGLGHMAYNLGKRFLIIPVKESGDLSIWMSYARTINQQTHGDAENLTGIFSYIYKKGSTAARLLVLGLVSLASVAGTGCVESGSVPEIISSVPEIIAYPVGAILAALAIYAAFTIAYHFLRLVFHVLFRLPIKLYRLLTDVVPRDLAIVEVAEEGLAFPENGKVVFKDTELASRLREEGVEFLMGDKLISKRFLKKLKKKSRNKDLDIKQFLKKNHVYPVKLHGQDFDQTLLGDVRERLRDSFRLLSVRYPQTFELFVKAVASIATKFNYDIYQKDHFLDEIKTLWHTTYHWREKGMPVYKYLLFLLKLNEAMDEVLASPGVKPETAGAFTWTIHWPNYYTAEGSLYILEKLVEKWRQFNDPGNAHVFFNIGVYILPGIDTGYGPGNKRFARKVMKKVIKATEHTFEHNPKFATLIEILQKKVNGEKIVFDGAEYTIREVSAPKADLGLGESSFRMVLVNEETGAEKQVECRWDYAYYAGREKMGAGVCRLLGQPAYAVDIYKIFEMDDTKYDEPVKMEFAWYMVEVPPSTDAEIEKAIDGKPEEVKRRLRGLGAIFAIEYALGAYGIEMGEIKLNSDNSYFRTTWKNVATWRNKTPHSEKYKGALEGAETDYLGDLLLQENGKELVAEVLDGFTQALGRMRREKDRIFSRVIKLWLGEAELEVFKGYFEKGLAVPDEEITKEPSKGIMRKLNIFRKIMEDIEDPETHAKLLRLTREFLRFYPINSAASIAKSFYENGFEFEDLSPGTIRAVVTLDDYIGGNNYRSEKDFSPGIYSQYFSDKLFLNIRFFLAKARYEELKELIRTEEISPERIVEAFLLNNQNSIISQTSELIRDYSGTRGVLRDLKSLSSKFNYEICTKERLEETLKALGISISDDELERIMREHGFKVFEHEDKLELFGEEKTRSLIIPLVFDNILSVYRGSAEYDNVEASYLTHAITTAIAHYANKGGEVKGESEKYPHGANAFHEFDLGFMMIEGRNHRSRDKNVTLAFHYEGVPLPEYARKRTVALKDAIVAGHISQLMEWQLKERRAKQNIHKILKWITEGVLGKKELQKAINILKKEILVLKDECGLKKEYFDAVFGYLDEEFFTELKHGYRPSRNNHRTLRKLLIEAMKRVIVVKTRRIGDKPEERVQHPWLKRIGVSKTILNYLHNEEKVRKGTFSETDVSTVKMEDITGKDGGEDQLEDSQLDTSGDARGEGFLGRIGKTRLVIAGIAAGLAGKAALAAEATEEIGGFLGLSSLTWVGVIGLVAMFGYMAYRIITSREYTGIEGILSTVAKRQNKQELDKLWEEVKKVEAKEKEYGDLSDEEIRHRIEKIKDEIRREYKSARMKVKTLRGLIERASDVSERNKHKEALQELKNGILDKHLYDVFAACREAARRTKNMRHYPVQILGGIAIHKGKIAEMVTGEGKTLVATLPATLNALLGEGVHVVTVNDYLARRDAELMRPVYEFLGLSVDYIQNDADAEDREEAIGRRKKAYERDIVYGTNSQFGFDYLKDNMVAQKDKTLQRGHSYAIVDEIDHVLIDDARTPLIISGQSADSNKIYTDMKPAIEKIIQAQEKLIVRYTTLLKEYLKSGDTEEAKRYLYLVHSADPENPEFQDMVSDKRTKRLLDKAIGFFEGKFRAEERDQLLEQLYFTVDGKTRTASFETRGMDLLYQRYGVDLVLRGTGPDPDEEDEKIPAHLRAGQNAKVRALHQLLTAYVVYHKDVDYFIRDGKVVIVDERRGRAEEGRRFSDGLHEALEAKEGVEIQKASINLASITIQNYFRMYDKLAGMTGTAKGEEREFKNTYSLAVVKVPTNRPLIRKGLPDKAYKTEEEKFNAIVEEIARLNAVGRPVLIGTRSIEKSEFLSELLTKRGIEHEVLNAKFDEEEARIVAQAGRFGAVTVATNMAGRGTDIILGGDPEDPEQRERVIRLGGLHVIGSERHDARRIDDQLSGRAGRQGDPGSHQFFVSREDDLLKHRAIKWPFTARIVRAAQRQVERDHSEVRKKVLEYDDVISRHREVIYKWRRKILMEENLKDVFSDCLREYLTAFLKDWEKEYSAKALSLWAKENLKVDIEPGFLEEKEANVIIARLMSLSKRNYSLAETNPNLGEEKIREQLLATVDYYWQEHMKKIESLKDHIGMRSYAQKDPKLEFRKDAFKLFGEFKMDIYEEIIKRVMVMSLFKRGERKAEKPDEPEPKTPKPGLIGKWQIDPEIKFMPGEEGSDKGVLVLEAWDIARSKKDPIEIRLRAERTSPEIFRDFKRTGHDVIDEALEAIRGKLKDRVFLIEPNGYGIEGIGTKEVLAILKPLQESRIAKFHELAHAYIDEELSEYEENGETGKDIEERSFLLKNIINEIIYASLSGRNALDMYLKEKAQKYRIPEDEETRKHWIDAWLPHYALRLFQKTYWGKEDMGLSAEIAKYGPSKSYPPSFPPDHIKFKDSPYQKLHGHLPIEMEIQEVKRNGPLIKPKRESGEFVLNAGVMALKGYRFLFNRIAEGGPNEKGIRRSRVGLLIHDKDFDKEKGEEEIIEIDKDMLLPEDEGLTSEISGVDPYEQLELEQRIANASSAEEAEHRQTVLVNLERDSEIVALEDPRVVERTIKIEKDDGTVEEKSYVYVFLTAVRRDGKYFSAVTMHDADKFFENAMKNHDKEKKEKIEWDWKPLKRLITDKKFRDSNIKNFVPFGNPANGEWYALFRPDQDHNSQIWLAKTDHTNGLAGPWEVVGPYHSTACPPFQWMGASAYVANIPDPEEFYGLAGFDLTLVHAAAGEGDKKYYDIRLFLTDRKDPTKKYISEPILKPEKGAPYEIENGHDLWVPGVIYSCGAILDRSKPNYKRGGYDLTIDIYYSGSDTAVLWATVKVFVKKREDEATKQALAETTKKISKRLKAVKPDKDDGEDAGLEDPSRSDGVSRRPDDEGAIEPPAAAAQPAEPAITREEPVIEIATEGHETGHDAYDEKFPLKNITDANKLADNLVELAISKVLSRDVESGGKEGPKKLVLAFDKNIMSKRALAVFKGLERLKRDPKYQVLLQNLEIVIERSEKVKEDDKLLSEELQKYAGKDDTVVFVFAEEKAGGVLSEFEPFKNINTSYIKIEGEMKIDHYYPLAEIVAMTLGHYLKKGCINGFTADELEKINLKPDPEVKDNGVLVFTILPKMGRYDYSDRHDRYVLLKRFLRAA